MSLVIPAAVDCAIDLENYGISGLCGSAKHRKRPSGDDGSLSYFIYRVDKLRVARGH